MEKIIEDCLALFNIVYSPAIVLRVNSSKDILLLQVKKRLLDSAMRTRDENGWENPLTISATAFFWWERVREQESRMGNQNWYYRIPRTEYFDQEHIDYDRESVTQNGNTNEKERAAAHVLWKHAVEQPSSLSALTLWASREPLMGRRQSEHSRFRWEPLVCSLLLCFCLYLISPT